MSMTGRRFQDPDLRTEYKENQWNSFKIWLDMDNKEIAYYLNGTLIACIPFDISVQGIRGFSFCKYEESDGVFYLDNLKMIKEDSSRSNGFSPVFISAATDSEVVGNNFYADKMPKFEVEFKNRLNRPKEFSVTYTAQTSDGRLAWSKKSELLLGADGSEEQTIDITAKQFGVMELVIEIDDGGRIYTKTVPYTLSNHTSDMPNNKRSGVHTAYSSGKETVPEAISVMKGAGIGNARGEELSWAMVENNGEYSLSEKQEEWLDLLSSNDIDYLFLLNYGHPDYGAENSVNNFPFADSAGYTALSNFCEELMHLANGRVKYVEVLNEVHAKLDKGYTSKFVADMHKAVYKGVKAGDENVMVLGIDEDSYAYNVSDYISGYLREMKGEKCFDYVSLHPYTRAQDGEPFYYEGDKAAKTFINGVRGKLRLYGYDYNTPIIFSEQGWGDTNPEMNFYKDYERQAAYTVRSHAYTWANGLAEVLFNYCLSDKMENYDTKTVEATYGITHSYTKSGAEIPYLGKPVYCALAYYNGLMAEAVFKEKIDLETDGSYAYRFKGRDSDDIVMLGMFDDGAKESVCLDIGNAKKAVVSDMYGNEQIYTAENGIIDLQLTDQPQYVIGNFEKFSVSDTIHKYERPMAILEGNVKPGEEIAVSVYRNGYSPANITPANAFDALYYHTQEVAGKNGKFVIEFPVENNFETMTAYVRAETEDEVRVYTIFEKEKYVLVKNEDKDNGICRIVATVFGEENQNDGLMFIRSGKDGVMKRIEVCEVTDVSANLMKFRGAYIKEPENEMKCFFWENNKNIKPIDESVIIE